MDNERLIADLEEFQQQFRDKGLCKIMSMGGNCRCPLCMIDDVIVLAKAKIRSEQSSSEDENKGAKHDP